MEIKRDFIFDPSLVLYLPLYKLDDASFMSKDAYGHLCTVTGALWRPNGRYFDETDDNIDLGAIHTIGTGDVSIEVWFKNSQTFVEGAAGYFIANKENFTNNFTKLIILRTPVEDVGKIDLYTEGAAGANEHIRTDDPYNDGIWHHVVVTRTGATGKIYIDGVEVKSGTTRSDDIGGATTWYIGSSGATAGTWYGGQIGEVRIYSRVLAFPEIQHNYEATKWRYQ